MKNPKIGLTNDDLIWKGQSKDTWFEIVAHSSQSRMVVVENVDNGGNPKVTYAHGKDFVVKECPDLDEMEDEIEVGIRYYGLGFDETFKEGLHKRLDSLSKFGRASQHNKK